MNKDLMIDRYWNNLSEDGKRQLIKFVLNGDELDREEAWHHIVEFNQMYSKKKGMNNHFEDYEWV